MEGKDTAANVPVDAGKLRNGLRTMFLGMSEIFESIGAEEAAGIVAAGKTIAGDAPLADEDVKEAVPAEEAEKAAKKKAGQKDTEAEEKTAAKTKKSTLTLGDLQKAAGAKIIAERSNQVKIQKMIASFGVEKLSDLEEGQYEAFMTQLGAL